MKTITEMQAQIKEMSAKLDEFARDLSDYNGAGKQDTAIDFKQIKAIGSRNPIEGHVLAKAEADVKKKYITMLVAIAYLAQENQENAWFLIQRIATGVNFKEELIDISVDAVNLTDAQIDEFTLIIANAKLTHAFVLDAMLIYLSCERANEKMLEFLSAMFELVKCVKNEVQELVELAKIIAEQDSKMYSVYCCIERRIDITEFLGYIKLFHEGVLCSTSKNFIVFYPEKKKISFDILKTFPDVITAEKVILQNTIFSNIDKEIKWFKLMKCTNVEINNCEFNDFYKYTNFNIEQSNNIAINNCKFFSMPYCALTFHTCNKININYCTFENCSVDGNGGAINAKKVDIINIENSSFISCSAKNPHGMSYSGSGAVAYLWEVAETKWYRNQFKYCSASREYLIFAENCKKIVTEECISFASTTVMSEFRSGFNVS